MYGTFYAFYMKTEQAAPNRELLVYLCFFEALGAGFLRAGGRFPGALGGGV